MATRKKVRRRPTVERKIYFYRADAGLDAGGQPIPFDPAPAFVEIDALPFPTGARYLDDNDGNATWCMIDHNGSPHRLRVAVSRRSNLPLLERNGQLSALNIPASSGLAEQIHVVFFPNNIVGSDFNFYGPRLSRLAYYLRQKTSSPSVAFEPLMRNDARQRLTQLRDIRLLDLKIKGSYAETVAQADQSLGAAFRAARDAGNADVVEIILRPQPYSRGGHLNGGLLQLIRSLGRRTDVRTEALKFHVKGFSENLGRVELVDVLSDQLISTKQIVRQDNRSRALDTESAYRAVQDAYNELRDELNVAASVSNGD